MTQAPISPTEPTAVVAGKILRSHASAFAALAGERGMTVSALIRELITRELELAGGRAPPGSAGG